MAADLGTVYDGYHDAIAAVTGLVENYQAAEPGFAPDSRAHLNWYLEFDGKRGETQSGMSENAEMRFSLTVLYRFPRATTLSANTQGALDKLDAIEKAIYTKAGTLGHGLSVTCNLRAVTFEFKALEIAFTATYQRSVS